MKKIKIADKWIGEGEPIFVIAEAGVNHNGQARLARKLIDVAVDAGVDAVKFQTFVTEEDISKYAELAPYQRIGSKAKSQLEMVKSLELSQDDFREISSYATRRNIMFLSTPFDKQSADLLDELNVPAFKIPSGEIVNAPLIEYIAAKGKPMIVSTGMSTMEEVREAVDIIRDKGNNKIVLLHCTSNYPAKIEDSNLKAMATLARTFRVPVGYSDHTEGVLVPAIASAMGACVIEKHFTLDKRLPGPDHKASLGPQELKKMVRTIRLVERALGTGQKIPVESEFEIMRVARRSIVAKVDIPKGSLITENMITFKRPGWGISPKNVKEVVGKKAKVSIEKDALVTLSCIEDPR